MRAVVQRVSEASVVVDDEIVGEIHRGLLVYLGAGRRDTLGDTLLLARKVAGLRIFPDEKGKMSRSVEDIGGSVLVVSQFTLFGDVRKGRRPSFESAAPPEVAEPLYEAFVEALRERELVVATGRFRAQMLVRSVGDGPVTILMDTHKAF